MLFWNIKYHIFHTIFFRFYKYSFIFIGIRIIINPLTSPLEVVTVFTYPYLSAGAPALGEAKRLIV